MTIEHFKEKVQYGDYQTLGKVLGISAEAAKMRLFRGDQKSANILQEIITQRENLIKKYQIA